LRLRRPVVSSPAPEIQKSVAIVPSSAPMISAAPYTPPTASANESSEPAVRRSTKAPRLKPSASIVARPAGETAPRANPEVVVPTPAPVASVPPARPRAKPSEFRPPDL
jgi:hypothetical protein